MTIIDVGDGGFIAGDPLAEINEGQHWCDSCGRCGIVLDLNWNDDLVPTVCIDCDGSGAVSCGGVNCVTCAQEFRDQALRSWTRRYERLMKLEDLCFLALKRAPIDRAWDHEMLRYQAVMKACDTLRLERPTLTTMKCEGSHE